MSKFFFAGPKPLNVTRRLRAVEADLKDGNGPRALVRYARFLHDADEKDSDLRPWTKRIAALERRLNALEPAKQFNVAENMTSNPLHKGRTS
jgi:hypothetical protein